MTGLPRIEEDIVKKIDVVDIRNDGEVTLHEILFDKDAVTIHGVHVKNVTFTKCLFTNKIIKSVKFQGCTFKHCQFNGVQIEECEFHGCEFIEGCFYKADISNTYLDPASFKFSCKWYYKWANVNAWWYQALYRNSKNLHQENFAMLADKKFQFYRRYEYLLGKRMRPFRFARGLLYDLTLGYGYGVLNALVVTGFVVAAFAFLIQHQTTLGGDAGFIELIYFSVVSFTTVGYGEVRPIIRPLALIITTAFLFFSIVWGSLVTAVIVKRLVK